MVRSQASPLVDHLMPGDQVSVSRGFYRHHAVYVSGDVLIEFGGGLRGGRVVYVSMEDFSRGRPVRIVRRGGDVAVARAKSRLGDGGFDVLSANCEHFATWCTTGGWESSQVQVAIAVGVVALLVVAATRAPRGVRRLAPAGL